jgi:hypothetical protein
MNTDLEIASIEKISATDKHHNTETDYFPPMLSLTPLQMNSKPMFQLFGDNHFECFWN